jgi:hypothetical protein
MTAEPHAAWPFHVRLRPSTPPAPPPRRTSWSGRRHVQNRTICTRSEQSLKCQPSAPNRQAHDPLGMGLVTPEDGSALLVPPLPRASRKSGHYRWSARWVGQDRLPFAPKIGKRPGWAVEIHHKIYLLPAALWSGWPDLNRRPLRPEAISADMSRPGQSRTGGPSCSPAQTL